MKPKHFILLWALLFITFSCNTDKPIPDPEIIDSYQGPFNILTLTNETQNFHHKDFTCVILAPDKKTVIEREGEHLRFNKESQLLLDHGLKAGVYRLLALRVDTVDAKSNKTYDLEYGLGCRIDIKETGETIVLDKYDEFMGFVGEGTESAPYIVSSSSHFRRIRDIINDSDSNHKITKNTYFQQHKNIDMDRESWDSDHVYGWLPIGSTPNNPYRGYYDGNGYNISHLWSKRPKSSGIGLFGFVENAMISNVTMSEPNLTGAFAVGSIVGAVVSPGDQRFYSIIRTCKSIGGEVSSEDAGMGIGGLVGVVDMKSAILIDSCENKSTKVTGMYGTGGLLGIAAQSSSSQITNSINRASVNSTNTGTGGLVGSADTLAVIACENSGDIVGSTRKVNSDTEGSYATGGLIGGAGPTQVLASKNSGNVTGYVGVGGIIGSTRVGSEQLIFNNVTIKSASNSGAISGENSVGGICGEAQLGGHALLNTGSINASGLQGTHIGGIAGNTSIAVVYNSVNSGAVNSSCTSGGTIGGILGKSDWASLLTCQNLGNITAETDHIGGVVALAGNNTIINYCSNSGDISSTRSNNHIGGIVGEIGDQREWSAENIAACVFGSIEIVLGVAGASFAVLGKFGESLEHAMHSLHMLELRAECLVLAGESVFMQVEIAEMIGEEECEMIKTNISSIIEQNDSEIKQEMDDVRCGFIVSDNMLQSGIKANTFADFTENLNKLNAFNEASDENNELINENINHKREARMENLEELKKSDEVFHKVVGGVCLLASTVTILVSSVVTLGAADAFGAALILAGSSVIGGTNSVLEATHDYKVNAVIVSQCANYGVISSNNVHNTGAIVGLANDNCWIRDCLNVKGTLSPNIESSNGIIGSEGNDVVLSYSLMLGNKWNYSCEDDSAYGFIFYTGEDGLPSLSDLSTIKTYKDRGYSISAASENNEDTYWVLKEEKGYYAIPQRSEMTDEIENE